MADPDDLEERSFRGRSRIIGEIMTALTDAEAETKRLRSIMVEGPTGRGKTWLLNAIYWRLQRQTKLAVYHLPADKVLSKPLAGDQRWLTLLAKVMLTIRPHLANPQPPFSDFERETPPEVLAASLAHFPVANLITEVTRQLTEHSLLLILIVDGLEDGLLEVCADFEINLLAPLFRSPQVRVLASRRSGGNPSYGWQHKHNLRVQTRIFPLDGWDKDDSPVVEPPDQPLAPNEQLFERQIADLIEADLLAGGTQLNPPQLVDRRVTLVARQPGIYKWSNPGLNACLVRKANTLPDPMTLGTADLTGCIEEKLRPPVAKAGPGHNEWETVYGQLRRIVKLINTAAPPIIKPMIAEAVELDYGATTQLLNELQLRGIGVNDRNGFMIFPEFIELISWINQLDPV